MLKPTITLPTFSAVISTIGIYNNQEPYNHLAILLLLISTYFTIHNSLKSDEEMAESKKRLSYLISNTNTDPSWIKYIDQIVVSTATSIGMSKTAVVSIKGTDGTSNLYVFKDMGSNQDEPRIKGIFILFARDYSYLASLNREHIPGKILDLLTGLWLPEYLEIGKNPYQERIFNILSLLIILDGNIDGRVGIEGDYNNGYLKSIKSSKIHFEIPDGLLDDVQALAPHQGIMLLVSKIKQQNPIFFKEFEKRILV